MTFCRVCIHCKVANTLELIVVAYLTLCKERLYASMLDNNEALRVNHLS